MAQLETLEAKVGADGSLLPSVGNTNFELLGRRRYSNITGYLLISITPDEGARNKEAGTVPGDFHESITASVV
jgi:hypothetical protein